MSMRDNKATAEELMDEKAVANYLHTHPDFFVNQPQLIADLTLPHHTGAAASLIERQVSVLRDQIRRYRGQLNDLIQNARDNDALIERLQRLSLNLMDVDNLNDILAVLYRSLKKDFHADVVTIQLFAEPVRISLQDGQAEFLDVEFVEKNKSNIVRFDKILANGEPVCGKLKLEQLDDLFGDKAMTVASTMLLPMQFHSKSFKDHPAIGMVAIGSRDAKRFHPGMGTAFLKYLGELLSRKLSPHFQPSQPADAG